MRTRKTRVLACDFETTVYAGQTRTEVWASACVELFTEDVKVFHSIDEQFQYFLSLKDNLICYYHNLKFDGSFWLSYLYNDLYWTQASEQVGSEEYMIKWLRNKDMPNKSFRYSISSKGQWYTIIMKINNRIIELRDSLKLLPFSLRKIGKSFKTKHQKLDMEYTGFRYAGCNITPEEMQYISNDVLVLKEALEIMQNEGHNKLTIGACCLDEYKTIFGKEDFKNLYPNMYEIPLDENIHGAPSVGVWIKRAYKGGWCYLVKGKENQLKHNGVTADVNSLYPSMMHSDSGNRFPTGQPTFWTGDIPDEALADDKYFFVRIRCRFYLKKDKLPFVQIKGNLLYLGTEMLETSDVYDPVTKQYYDEYIDLDGNIHDTKVVLTLTQTDFFLLIDHYDLVDLEFLDGCYFTAFKGLFDKYIDKYAEIKKNSTGAIRELAKLFLNNLYGKFATNTDSSFKVAYVKEDKTLGFMECLEFDKIPGYIPIGAAITSYARNFTIRAAQANYYGKDKAGFIYADTDSIHCDLPPDKLKNITVHPTNFCCWKLEASWDNAIFVRQKTYIEHVIAENLEPLPEAEHFYNIKCAGMPESCKHLFLLSMTTQKPEDDKEYSKEKLDFIQAPRKLEDFKVGLKIPGKLMPKRIQGGVLLVETTYEMR